MAGHHAAGDVAANAALLREVAYDERAVLVHDQDCLAPPPTKRSPSPSFMKPTTKRAVDDFIASCRVRKFSTEGSRLLPPKR